MEGWEVAKIEIANLPDKLSAVNFLLATFLNMESDFKSDEFLAALAMSCDIIDDII